MKERQSMLSLYLSIHSKDFCSFGLWCFFVAERETINSAGQWSIDFQKCFKFHRKMGRKFPIFKINSMKSLWFMNLFQFFVILLLFLLLQQSNDRHLGYKCYCYCRLTLGECDSEWLFVPYFHPAMNWQLVRSVARLSAEGSCDSLQPSSPKQKHVCHQLIISWLVLMTFYSQVCHRRSRITIQAEQIVPQLFLALHRLFKPR